ncbi:LOW QUALITY PROTEIN: thrombospondin type-1 domain-containing protein 7A-like [Antedon mediterranea]|uniref:LOW QUALITY PROTEIN: thrombospondin type-1 domain-containing protein 7A-like n=1 Tax=Antedon mediterranea TaxID=105859 RepID=UPI003AF84B64
MKRLMFLLFVIFCKCCNNVQAQGYVWETGPWGKCQSTRCGHGGLQNRAVWCIDFEGWTVLNENCNIDDKPPIRRDCFKVCEQHSYLFDWEIGEWNECSKKKDSLSENQHAYCGPESVGEQERPVKCQEKVTNYVDTDSDGIVQDYICELFSVKPLTLKSCLLPCKQDCIVSSFSDWSECSNPCGNGTQTRIREVIIPAQLTGKSCPSLSELQPCDNTKECPPSHSPSYYLKIGEWSACSVQAIDKDETPGLPVGQQLREFACVNSNGNLVSLQTCLDQEGMNVPTRYRPCVPPTNCKATQDFSEWRVCPAKSFQEFLQSSTLTRTRAVLKIPMGGGDRCPALQETKTCGGGIQKLETRFIWHVSAWSQCSVTQLLTADELKYLTVSGNLCGGGVRYRDTFCVKQNDTTYAPVENSLCSGSPSPNIVEECNVPCTMNCEVSPWSVWSKCIPTTCPVGTNATSNGIRERKRVILVEPSSDGAKCPDLTEAMDCDNGRCFQWDVGKTDCIPSNTTKLCGVGNKTRTVLCIDNDGNTVSDSACGSYKPQTSLGCWLPCPGDCVLGEWSNWSECSKTCIGKNNRTGSMFRNRSIVAAPSENGSQCPNRRELQQSKPCGLEPCLFFQWVTYSWGSCKAADAASRPVELAEGVCQVGIQRRKVECSRLERNKTASEDRCGDFKKPDTTQQCTIPCTQDCHVSAYSEFNACPDTCHDSPTRHRRRYILQESKNNGKTCPNNLYDRRLCEVPEHCNEYKWTYGVWDGDCKLPSRKTCGPGLQTRDVVCLKGQEATDINFCLKYSSEMPVQSKPCDEMCDNECLLTNWAEWGDCTNDCKGIQTRSRKLKGNKKVNVRCKDRSLFPTRDMRPCECDTFSSVSFGNWSQCLLGLQSTIQGSCKVDGMIIGLKYRARVCQNQQGQMSPIGRCDLEEDFETMNCSLPCPVNCELSQWTPWSSCSKTVGAGIKTRTRHVVKPDKNGGRPCPPHNENQIIEEVSCYTSPDQFFWKAGPWADCSLQTFEGNGNCGSGTQYRNVRCYSKATPIADTIPTYDNLCSGVPPSSYRQCRIACSDELIVGEWSEWTECPMECKPGNLRTRERAVLRYPSTGRTPSDSMETAACECERYNWIQSDFGACELHPKSICGQGKQSRSLDCISNLGVSVPWSVCQKYNLQQPTDLVKNCTVTCPVDCILSEWSEWTSCSQTCGLQGIMSRSRQKLQEPNEIGQACPTQRFQQKPCPVKPCYKLVVDEWGYCQAENGYCGQGSRKRQVRCTQEHNGAVVKDNKCVTERYFKNNINITAIGFETFQREQACTVPCPGECQLTEWSKWSPCFIMCINGKPSGSAGIQSRSRASISVMKNCQADEVDARPCQGDTCYTFTWQTGTWYEGDRQVWCQRSDGVNVTGGCLENKKPEEMRQCGPPCTVQNSYCAQNGKCQCKTGLKPSYSTTSGDILRCASPDELITEKPGSGKVAENVKNQTEPDDQKGIFDSIPVWMYPTAGGALLIIIIMLILIYCTCCGKQKKNKQPTLQQKHLELDHSIYWDDTAKRKYMDGVHV